MQPDELIGARFRSRPRSKNQPNHRSFIMSGINGDKARFNRLRKQKIARRLRKQEMLKGLAAQTKPAASSKTASE